MTAPAVLSWTEPDGESTARWHSENGAPMPRRVIVGDDELRADDAYRLACEGTAILWRGDFQNARQLLTAISRRVDRRKRKTADSPAEAFNLHRKSQAERARTLGMLLIPVDAGAVVPLRRAPDVRQACAEAECPVDEPFVLSLRELLGLIGAREWRKKGVEVPALGARVHAYYGVFSPVRGEYVDLVADAPLPEGDTAFDIGTGTGVLAAVLAKRGVKRVVGTDQDERALACARENLKRLDYPVEVVKADLFPPGRASVVVCNPPWIPAKPSSPLEYAIFDPNSRMLKGFLAGLGEHLEPGGEGWLILSDIAEHLGLRTRAELLTLFQENGFRVIGRVDITPSHPKAANADDPLHAARAAETTSLWRLVQEP